jgi:hypothetical protein
VPLLLFHRLGRSSGFIEQRQRRRLGEFLVRTAAPASKQIDGGIACRCEQKRPGAGNGFAFVRPQRAYVGFLHQIVVVGQRRKPLQQTGAQRRFVGLDVFGKSTGLFSRGHRGDAAARTELNRTI